MWFGAHRVDIQAWMDAESNGAFLDVVDCHDEDEGEGEDDGEDDGDGDGEGEGEGEVAPRAFTPRDRAAPRRTSARRPIEMATSTRTRAR